MTISIGMTKSSANPCGKLLTAFFILMVIAIKKWHCKQFYYPIFRSNKQIPRLTLYDGDSPVLSPFWKTDTRLEIIGRQSVNITFECLVEDPIPFGEEWLIKLCFSPVGKSGKQKDNCYPEDPGSNSTTFKLISNSLIEVTYESRANLGYVFYIVTEVSLDSVNLYCKASMGEFHSQSNYLHLVDHRSQLGKEIMLMRIKEPLRYERRYNFTCLKNPLKDSKVIIDFQWKLCTDANFLNCESIEFYGDEHWRMAVVNGTLFIQNFPLRVSRKLAGKRLVCEIGKTQITRYTDEITFVSDEKREARFAFGGRRSPESITSPLLDKSETATIKVVSLDPGNFYLYFLLSAVKTVYTGNPLTHWYINGKLIPRMNRETGQFYDSGMCYTITYTTMALCKGPFKEVFTVEVYWNYEFRFTYVISPQDLYPSFSKLIPKKTYLTIGSSKRISCDFTDSPNFKLTKTIHIIQKTGSKLSLSTFNEVSRTKHNVRSGFYYECNGLVKNSGHGANYDRIQIRDQSLVNVYPRPNLSKMYFGERDVELSMSNKALIESYGMKVIIVWKFDGLDVQWMTKAKYDIVQWINGSRTGVKIGCGISSLKFRNISCTVVVQGYFFSNDSYFDSYKRTITYKLKAYFPSERACKLKCLSSITCTECIGIGITIIIACFILALNAAVYYAYKRLHGKHDFRRSMRK